jgi:hypothetical protein
LVVKATWAVGTRILGRQQVRACFEEDLGLTKLLEYFNELGGNCVEQRLVVLGICLSLE